MWGVQVGYAGDFETVIMQTGSDHLDRHGAVSDAPAGLINSAAVGVDYSLAEVTPTAKSSGSAPKSSTGSTPPPSFDPGEHTVADVQDYLAAHPDQVDAVLAAEAAGKARSTLLAD